MKTQSSKKAFSFLELSVVIILIGVLAAGIISGKRMISQSNLVAAQALTKSAQIASIPDLTLWLEPTLTGSITGATTGNELSNNDPISAWNDISGNKNVFAQSTSGDRPKYLASGINSLPSISFDGTSDYLDSTIAPIGNTNDAYTIVGVWRPTATPASFSYIFSQCPAVITDGTCASHGSYFSSSVLGFVFNGSATAYTYKSSVVPVINTSYITILSINDAVANNVRLYINEIDTPIVATSGMQGSFNLGDDRAAIGTKAISGGGGFYFQGYISEIMVFDRYLKPSEITLINNYLSKKYNITLS